MRRYVEASTSLPTAAIQLWGRPLSTADTSPTAPSTLSGQRTTKEEQVYGFGMATPGQEKYAMAVPYIYSSSFAKDNIAAHYGPVMPTRLLDSAVELVQGTAYQRHSPSRPTLFNASDKRCLLCAVPTVDSGLQVHTHNFMHQARVGVVDRAVALVNWHLQLVGNQLQQMPLFAQCAPQTVRSNVKDGSTTLRTPVAGCGRGTGVGYGYTYVFQEGVAGMPSIDAVAQNPSILKDVNWSRVVAQHWWRMLDVRAAEILSADSATAASMLRGPLCNSVVTADFGRIPSLSADSVQRRKWRIRYLLRFLMKRGVLRDSLQLSSDEITGIDASRFARTTRFERCEMVGDNVLKNVIRDRLLRIFPTEEGGLNGRLAQLQQVIDSNPGLLAIYDHLEFDNIVGARLPNNKTKADVVESLFGELQTFLWASEVRHDTTHFPAFFDREQQYVRALVEHVLNELAHTIVMWRLSETLDNAREFIEAHTVGVWVDQRSGASHSSSAGRGRRGGGPSTRDASLSEEVLDRGPYDTLPLLTHVRRPLPIAFADAKDMWYHSKHLARTHTGPHQDILRTVEPAASPEATTALQAHYSRDALRVAAGSMPPQRQPAAVSSAVTERDEEGEEHTASSLGALRYARWHSEDEKRSLRQLHAQAAETQILPPLEVSQLLRKRMEVLRDDTLSAGKDVVPSQSPETMASFPDFTPRRQPRPGDAH